MDGLRRNWQSLTTGGKVIAVFGVLIVLASLVAVVFIGLYEDRRFQPGADGIGDNIVYNVSGTEKMLAIGMDRADVITVQTKALSYYAELNRERRDDPEIIKSLTIQEVKMSIAQDRDGFMYDLSLILNGDINNKSFLRATIDGLNEVKVEIGDSVDSLVEI